MVVGIERVQPEQVAREVLDGLALNAGLGVHSLAAIAGSVRRAASFMCPTTAGNLVRAVKEGLQGLPDITDETYTALADVVSSLVAHGDLLELPVDDGTLLRRQIFLAPPAFVPFATKALLIGIRPDGVTLINEELLEAIEHIEHIRVIRPIADQPIDELLLAEGLLKIQPDRWLEAPRQATADGLLGFYAERLEAAGPAGDIEGIQVIDPASNPSYYRGRWRAIGVRDAGRFVARRPQAFGSPLWCFAEADGGRITRLVDLPLGNPLAPGADEAWRLQAAMDAAAGRPQRVRVRAEDGESIMDLFSPLPSWAQRRLAVVGGPAPRGSGALFSYYLPAGELVNELGYLQEMMWLAAEGLGDRDASQ